MFARSSETEIPIWSAADLIESKTPVAKSGGVDKAFPRITGSPTAKTTVSVQVPPTSVATR